MLLRRRGLFRERPRRALLIEKMMMMNEDHDLLDLDPYAAGRQLVKVTRQCVACSCKFSRRASAAAARFIRLCKNCRTSPDEFVYRSRRVDPL